LRVIVARCGDERDSSWDCFFLLHSTHPFLTLLTASILNEPVAGRACVLLVIRWCEQEVIGVLCVGSMQ